MLSTFAFKFNLCRYVRAEVKQLVVNRANAAVRVFQQCNATVNRAALAGRAESVMYFMYEFETLELVKDIFEEYGRVVRYGGQGENLVPPYTHRSVSL